MPESWAEAAGFYGICDHYAGFDFEMRYQQLYLYVFGDRLWVSAGDDGAADREQHKADDMDVPFRGLRRPAIFAGGHEPAFL